MNIDTLVMDMDDTLFDGEGKISPKTLQVMQECTARGIRVIPASGRTLPSLRPYLQQLNTGCPYIGCNGAQIISADHQMMEESALPQELAKDICRYLQAEGFYAQVYRDERFYYNEECDISRKYKNSSGLAGVAVGDVVSFIDFPVPKILCVNHPSEVDRVLPMVRKHFGGKAEFTLSKPFFIEAVPPGVSKGNALRRLAELIGIQPERTMVFGDSLNDISMFSFTPNSVAMGNGRAEAKAAANYVCLPNTEDGLARFVEEHVLCTDTKEGQK